MRKYNIINNSLGWLVFLVAAITYLLTIEPTASFWDCPEFVAQGYKLEVGHPPGNPIFILVARFATLFAGGDVMAVSKCVNAMSALLSAATILLLFWTITHLVKKLVVKEGEEGNMSLAQYLVIMGSGLCGALAYTWSDTFWFSAVEAEVYAFSSFCTALVFWLILKWEDRADDPKSDRWFILIAYVFGISLGVHLLNLLCLPAIALVVYYRKVKKSKVTGSLLTLLISFMMIVFILYGLEPGFVKWGGLYELFFTNTLGMPFNTGVVLYVITMIALFAWCIFELKRGKNDVMIKISFILCIFFSGMFFLGSGVMGIIITLLLLGCLVYFLFVKDKITTRLISNVVLCTFMIFLGFTSYGVILIRSNANTPLDENSPNSPFALTSYLSRDQYGKSPLFYGRVFTSQPLYVVNDDGHTVSPKTSEGRDIYSRKVKANADEPDKYILTGVDEDIKYTPELNMIFPRIYDNLKANGYREWITPQDVPDYVEGTLIEFPNGTVAQTQSMESPSFGDNLEYFFKYQLNHMYFRYFMWNFAGRQNDIQGNGEITQGNWISGIPFIDNARLGDQSLLPEDYTTGNKGHNVFYCLPLLLGLLGLLWQSFSGKKGIQQFWVIFFLFFMTGIAIVLYLNQPPGQPRERDYAYAGSFYAFAIWIGMGVAAIWKICLYFIKNFKAKQKDDEKTERSTASLAVAGVAAVIGLAVPLQMVSQTWDDHDRSGRYCARDFGMNYLASVDKDAIIFTNGDNDTFPLWYLQEVEGYRTDVRVVNLSYLATDWYIAQMRRASYDSKPLPMLANDNTFAYTDRQINYFTETADSEAIDILECLEQLYTDSSNVDKYNRITGNIKNTNAYIPVDASQVLAQKVVPQDKSGEIRDRIDIDLLASANGQAGLNSSQVMVLDLVASSIKDGWKRPCYFAYTVDPDLYTAFLPYLRNTGLALQVTPLLSNTESQADILCNTDKMYDIVTKKFIWGGLDRVGDGSIYLDQTVRNMVSTMRRTMLDLATDLISEEKYDKAMNVLTLMETKMPEKVCDYDLRMGGALTIARLYDVIGDKTNNEKAKKRAVEITKKEILRYAKYMRFYKSLYDEYGLDDSGQFAFAGRLSAIDNNVMYYYMPQLLRFYEQINPDDYQKVFDSLNTLDTDNVKGVAGFIQQMKTVYEQGLQARYAPEEQAPDDDNQESNAAQDIAAALMPQNDEQE